MKVDLNLTTFQRLHYRNGPEQNKVARYQPQCDPHQLQSHCRDSTHLPALLRDQQRLTQTPVVLESLSSYFHRTAFD